MKTKIANDVVLDELSLTLEELARACNRDPQWVTMRIEAELIASTHKSHFTSTDLVRARRIASIESMFETNLEATGFIVDLIEEINRLRRTINLTSSSQ